LTTASGSFSTRISSIEGNYATTGSNVFMGAQTICANITSTGTIVAQTINVQQVTSSIVYSSGSNIFGNLSSDVQQMTGSLRITGSLNVTGNACFTNCITACNAFIQVPSTAAVVDILRLNNPAVASSGTRLKFENGYGDLAALRVTHMDNGSLADDGQIEFQTAQNAVLGTRMTILNSGLVGIGTLCPSAELQINKTCDVTVALSSCVNVTSGNRGSIAFYNCATSTVGLIRATAVTDNVGTQLEFHTRPAAGSLTQNVTISSVGQLLVNTTNWPSSVIGNSANRHMMGGATEPVLILWNEATAAANNQSSIWLGAKSATGATYIGGGVIQGGLENATNSCGYLAFRTTDTTAGTNERIRITGGGCVGIRTCSPRATLHVQQATNDGTPVIGTARDGAVFTSNNGNYGLNITIDPVGITHMQAMRFDGQSIGYNLILQPSACNVGIGTTGPGQKLAVQGNSYFGCLATTLNFSQGANDRFIEVGSGGGGDALLVTHASGYGVGYFGYEASNDRLVIATDCGGGNNKIDFILNAGATIGGTADNLNACPVMRITSGNLILACGRMSSIMASNGNIQEYVGTIGAVSNNTGWSLFSIANQYDILTMDIFVFTDAGSFHASKHNVIFGYTASTYIGIGYSSAFCIFSAGTLYNETMRICNLSGSGTNLQRVAVRVWGYGVGQNGTGGTNLLNTSCLTRIK